MENKFSLVCSLVDIVVVIVDFIRWSSRSVTIHRVGRGREGFLYIVQLSRLSWMASHRRRRLAPRIYRVVVLLLLLALPADAIPSASQDLLDR